MANKRTLGRGLQSLIPDTNDKKEQKPQEQKPLIVESKPFDVIEKPVVPNQPIIEQKVEEVILPTDEVTKLAISDIRPRINQPRKSFDDDALEELAASINEYGLLNPIVVTRQDDHYQIIAGERRYRATKKLGKSEIDVIIRNYNQRDVEVLSLIENVQREDLKALEEATAYKRLADNFQMTQEQIAKTMGKSRSYIANTMRLLNLNDSEKEALNNGKITSSQARTLLSISDEDARSKTLDDFINNRTNIKTVEKKNKKPKEEKAPSIDDILIEDLEERFMEEVGSMVSISKSGSAFKVTINCHSIEDIEEIFGKLSNEA